MGGQPGTAALLAEPEEGFVGRIAVITHRLNMAISPSDMCVLHSVEPKLGLRSDFSKIARPGLPIHRSRPFLRSNATRGDLGALH